MGDTMRLASVASALRPGPQERRPHSDRQRQNVGEGRHHDLLRL